MKHVSVSEAMELVMKNDCESLESLFGDCGEDLIYELNDIAEFAAALPNIEDEVCELLVDYLIPQTSLANFSEFAYYAFYGYDHMSDTANDSLKQNIIDFVATIKIDDMSYDYDEEKLDKILDEIEALEAERIIGLALWFGIIGNLNYEISSCIMKRFFDLKIFTNKEMLMFLSASKDIDLLFSVLIEDGIIETLS